MSDEVKEEAKKKVVAKTLTDTEMEAAVLSTRDMLNQQPKFKIRIRKDGDPKSPNYETVQVNGYTYTIMKGVDVEVPQTVRDILVEANII
jgi:hypothetical protein